MTYTKCAHTLCVAVGALFLCGATWANDILQFGNDIHITDSETLSASRIEITRSLRIFNDGTISGDIYVGEGLEIYVQNTGKFTGTIHLGERARVTQVINSPTDITDIGCAENCTVLVQTRFEMVNLADILAAAPNAQKYVFEQTIINMAADEVLPANANLRGNCIIHVSEETTEPVDVNRGTGSTLTYSDDDSAVHTTNDGNSRVDFSRSAGDANTRLVDALTVDRPNDPLIKRLNAAQSTDDAMRVFGRSFRVRPIELMRVPEMMDRFVLSEFHGDDHVIADGFGVFGDNMLGGGMRFGIGLNPRPVRIAITGNYARFRYDDGDVNEFDGALYGMTGAVTLNLTHFWADVVGGMSFSDFDMGPVLRGDDVVRDPHGKSFFGRGDVGARFAIGDGITMTPLVGAGVHRSEILNAQDTTSYGRAGLRMDMSTVMDGFGVSAGMRATYNTDGVIDASVNATVHLAEDGVGFGLGGGIYYDPDHDGTSYRVTIRGTYLF